MRITLAEVERAVGDGPGAALIVLERFHELGSVRPSVRRSMDLRSPHSGLTLLRNCP